MVDKPVKHPAEALMESVEHSRNHLLTVGTTLTERLLRNEITIDPVAHPDFQEAQATLRAAEAALAAYINPSSEN